MNKIIPFKKELTFITDIYDITSISLEHNYKIKDNEVTGEFIVSGEYVKNRTNTINRTFKILDNIGFFFLLRVNVSIRSMFLLLGLIYQLTI